MDLPPESFVPFVERRHHALRERAAVLEARSNVGADDGLDGLDQQLLRQHDIGGIRIAERPQLAAPYQTEALVAGNHPCFFGRKGVFLAEQLEIVGVSGASPPYASTSWRQPWPWRRGVKCPVRPSYRPRGTRALGYSSPPDAEFHPPLRRQCVFERTPPPNVTTMTRRSGFLNLGVR